VSVYLVACWRWVVAGPPAYTLLKVEPNPALSKVNMDVLLPGKLTEEELRQVALHLKAEHSGYAKTWIFYYLPGMKPGAGAWATTHFTPDLEVSILGASQVQERQAKQADVPGTVLGRWYEEQYTQSGLVIYQQKGRYHIRTRYKDGTSSDELLKRKGNTFTYAETGSFNGEYFKLLPNGNLGLLNREGKLFTQAKPTR
jgi:hypothetical protein